MRKAAIVILLLTWVCGVRAEEIFVRAGRNKDAVTAMNEGNQLAERGDLTGARQCFDLALRLDPSAWPVFSNRAHLSLRGRKV